MLEVVGGNVAVDMEAHPSHPYSVPSRCLGAHFLIHTKQQRRYGVVVLDPADSRPV